MTETNNHCNTCPNEIRGLCCFHKKTYNPNTGELIYSEPCQYLNKAKRCRIYKKRHEINPNCLHIEYAVKICALPPACPYYKELSLEVKLNRIFR